MDTEAVLFDFGGTLLEYHREEVMRALLQSKGVDVMSEKVLDAYAFVEPAWNRLFSELSDSERCTNQLLRQLDRMIIEHLGVKGDLDLLSGYVQENWDRVDHQLPSTLTRRPFPDALQCLKELSRKGLKMGIVSNIQSEERLREELCNVNLLSFFPVLVASGSVGINKPSKAIFHLAASSIGFRPECIMFVGDDLERDYRGSRGAGMNGVLLDREGKYMSHNSLTRVSSLMEIPGIIR